MTTLIVPVVLDLLMVRKQLDGKFWADTAMHTPRPQSNRRVRQQLDTDPFSTMAEGRAPGAYLHWALPDALTRGELINDKLVLPPVPNRWLILRLSSEDGSVKRRVDAWLLPDGGAENAIVIHDILSGEKPPADPGKLEDITALGPGSFGWAGYFDNVTNRFAFYDDLANVSGAVAYTICGWYSDVRNDPVFSSNEADFFSRMDKQDWTLARPLADGEPFPERSVYSAHALGYGWPDAGWPGDGGTIGTEKDLRPDADAIEVALGETIGEAAVSILDNDLDPVAARMLEARLSGIVGDATGVDGLADIEAKLNAARFGSAPGDETSETVWQGDNSGDDLTGNFLEVERTTPRSWQAVDPAIVLQGAGRSGKHGDDGRFGENEDLLCRFQADCVRAFGLKNGDSGKGSDVLPQEPLKNIALECDVPEAAGFLLEELASLDPASAPDIDVATANSASPVAQVRARWWDSFAAGEVEEPALKDAAITGILPSPLAIAKPERPWTPLHLDWQLSYLPSAHGTHDWELVDSDYELPQPVRVPAEDSEISFSGRSSLSASAARMIEFALSSESGEQAPIFDLVGGSLENFTAKLRGDRLVAIVTADYERLDKPMPLDAMPDDFRPLRAGFLRLDCLRLVDGFGQYIDIAYQGASSPLQVKIGQTLQTQGHAQLAALRPRFTSPAQINLRFMDAAGAEMEASEAVSPVCGFILPSPRETSLELFDLNGQGLGRLFKDPVKGIGWEERPGMLASLGARPGNRIGNMFLRDLADAILDADLDFQRHGAAGAPGSGTLESLLRVIDTARWTTDLTGNAGDEHLSLILGQPAVIVRAKIRIDVFDERNPPENATTAIAVRLGSMARISDGLLGFYIDDDYFRLHILDPGLAEFAQTLENESLLESFIDSSGVFYLNPNIDVPLTLIMEPASNIEVTSGVLPQKQIGLRRDWTAAALSRLSPTLRFGPLLRDEDSTRIPVASDIRGNWTWHRRPDPVSWASDETVPANSSAQLPEGPVLASDGWLQVELIPDNEYDGAIDTRIEYVTKNNYGSIETIGGHNADGTIFMLPVGQAVQLQESGRFSFYVQQGSTPRTPLQVVHMDSGRRYMRSTADITDENNLANLPHPPTG